MPANDHYTETVKLDYGEWLNHANLLLNGTKGGKRRHGKSFSENYQHSLKGVYFYDKAERFIQAAEAFRACSKFLDASDCYSRAASIFQHQLGCHDQAALLYTEAGLCLEKIETAQGSDDFGKIRNTTFILKITHIRTLSQNTRESCFVIL